MDGIQISNTNISNLPMIIWLFNEAMKMQGKNGYKVWESIDGSGLEKDMENCLQYKMVSNDEIICVFSIQYNDPFIWRDRDKNDGIYLHRIVVNPKFKGQKLFEKILNWAIELATIKQLKFIRMDTWAENHQLIGYYKLFGFQIIENYKTTNTNELPVQNRNLNVTLLELKVD